MTIRNTEETPVREISEQMREPRPLPLGRKEFEEWSDRIIAGAMIPGATVESQKFALAEMILHVGQTDSHVPDARFIHQLRVGAAKQVAMAMFTEIKEAHKARQEAEKLKIVPPGDGAPT